MNPEDRGPSSERVVKLNLANPVHAGIVKNKENNPNYKITHTEKGAVLSTAVAPGMEFEPRPSTKYPSFNTETTPYKYEPPKVEEAPQPKKKAASKPKKPLQKVEIRRSAIREISAKKTGGFSAFKKNQNKSN